VCFLFRYLPIGCEIELYSTLDTIVVDITDWLPTLMGIATNNAWIGSYANSELDGFDMWSAILSDSESPRHEIVHYVDDENIICSYQYDYLKIGTISLCQPHHYY
jgi:hypothetical protein